MIKINAGFHLGAPSFLDDRQYLSKAEMVAANDNIYPEYFIAVCKDDGKIYLYNKNNEPSAETGKFVVQESGLDTVIQKEVLPDADENVGKVYQYIGETGAYTKGYWYISLPKDPDSSSSGEGDYTWTALEVQHTPVIALDVATTPKEGYLKTYVLKSDDEELGTIDIPKDLVVTSGKVTRITKLEESSGESTIFVINGDILQTYTEADTKDKESAYYAYPTEAGVFIQLSIANQDYPIFVNTKDLIDDDLGVLTEDVTANVEVGGIKADDVVAKGSRITEFVKQLLIKYYEPAVTITATPTNKVVKKGSTINVEATAVVTKKSEDITKISFYKNDVLAQEITEDVAEGGTFVFTDEDPVTTDATYKVVVTDGKSTVEAEVEYVFVDPYLYGVSDTNDPDLTALTEVIEVKGTKTLTYTADNQYIVFAYPASYGALTSILDSNGFENIDSFDVAEKDDYKVYTTITKVTASGFKYIFK